MYSITSTPRIYPHRFIEIYSLSKDFCTQYGANFDEVFSQAVKFHDPRYSISQIWGALERNKKFGTFRRNCNTRNPDYSVWLTFGETGQGKSAFTNAICEKKVAVEGRGINSKTENIGLYTSQKHQIIVIDTPGLFDTRRIKNRETSNKVVRIVQNELKQGAHIDAIFFIWCPTSSMRLRFEEILANLTKALGDEAINSVVFIINKVSRLWNQDFDDLSAEFQDLLYENDLKNPVFECDLKEMAGEDIQELKKLATKVDPYREEDFEAHRITIHFNQFLEVQRADEEEKREQAKKQEEEENNKILQERRQAAMEALQEQNRQLEIRLEKEKAEREAEEKRRKEEDERKRKLEEERIRQEQRRHEEEARMAQSYSSLYYSIPSYIPWALNDYSPQTSTLASTDGMKFYKGGQFVPGGGHAPKGGCYMPLSSPSSHSVKSSHSGGGGGTFYKGGQFMPGGGRAPKGGAYA